MVIDNSPKEIGAALSPVWRQVDDKGIPDPLLDLIAARFRLLGEPLRLRILATLATGERSVGELVTLTGAGQANVSKHLAVLTQGGLVSRRKVGTSIYYAIADPTAFTLCDVVCAGVQELIAARARAVGIHATGEAHKDAIDKDKAMEV